jgi:hypothetical protein
MKVLIDIPDNEAAFGIKVLKSLSFVKKQSLCLSQPLPFGTNSKKLLNKYGCTNKEN